MMDSPLWFRYADNMVYLARSVPEGRNVLRKVRRKINPVGLTLKGEDGVCNLAKGQKAQILGFSLMRRGDEVVFGLGNKALDHLTQSLGDAHATSHPPESARASLL